MEKRELKIDTELYINGLSFIPVIEINLQYQYCNNAISCYYSRSPVIILIISEQTAKAFHISGKELPLQELCMLIPDLAEIVATRGV
jgi:hypothetical protein